MTPTERRPGRRSPADPRARPELGGVARRRRLGAVRHRLARRRGDDGHLVPGPGRRLHPRQPRGVRARREHPPLPRRIPIDLAGDPRDRPDEDDDLPARRGARRRVRRRLHRALLRLPRAARRPLGHRPAPADLREGPPRPGRSRRDADARPASCSTRSRPATATSPMSRPRSATRSSATCRG